MFEYIHVFGHSTDVMDVSFVSRRSRDCEANGTNEGLLAGLADYILTSKTETGVKSLAITML